MNIIQATKKNNLELVKELIKVGAIIDNKFIENITKYDIDLLRLLINNNFNIGLKYVKKFNKEKDLKYYVKLLIINFINNLNINQYEKGLINIILNYYV
jgi:hypothetical protein